MNLTIKKRLLLSNLTSLAFVVIVGLIGYYAVGKLDNAMDAISINGTAIKAQLQADQAHDALRSDVLAALLAGANADADGQKQAAADARDHAALLTRSMGDMALLATDAQLKQAMAQVRPDVDAYLAGVNTMLTLAVSDKEAAQAGFAGFMATFRKLEKSMEKLSSLIEANSVVVRERGDEVVVTSGTQIIGTLALSVLVTLAAGMAVARSIIRPLDEAIGFAARIATGDLAGELAVDPKDDTETGRLKRALGNMRASLHGIVTLVRASTETMAAASDQIATGNMDLSARTEMQASSLEETAASIEELTSTVKQNAGNARQANALATSALEVAGKGYDVVASVVTRWGRSTAPRARSSTSSPSSRALRSRPISWPSLRRWRRPGPRLCGGGARSAQPGAALEQRGEGNQPADWRFGRAGQPWQPAGRRGRRDDARHRRQRDARDRHHGRNQHRQPAAAVRHRTGQPGGRADRLGDPAECGAGRRGGSGGRVVAGAGGCAGRGGQRVYPGRAGASGNGASRTRASTGSGAAGTLIRNDTAADASAAYTATGALMCGCAL